MQTLPKLVLTLAVSLALPAWADGIRIHEPWARATAPGAANGVVFMRIDNAGAAGDRLVKAVGDVSAKVEMHTHQIDAGVARMREVAGIDVPAAGSVELKPGGLHLMLIGLRKPLREGARFPLTLNFEKAGVQTVEVVVRGVKGDAAADRPVTSAAGGHHHHH